MAPALLRGLAVVTVAAVAPSAASAAPSWSDAMRAAFRAGQPPPIIPPDLPGHLVAGVAAGAAGLERPKVPAKWSAKLIYDGSFAGLQLENGDGHFHYDRENRRFRSSYYTICRYFRPYVKTLQDQLTYGLWNGSSWVESSNLTWGSGDGGTCMPWFGSGGAYNDMFDFLQVATPGGEKIIHGEPCRIWSLKLAQMGFELSACIGEDGYPRFLNQTITSTKFSGYARMTFSNIQPGDPGDEAFRVSQVCATSYPMPPCSDEGVASIDIYRIFGPPEPLELDSRNGGDVLGDLAFVCTQGSGEAYESKLITFWKLNVSRAFGQYSLCNFDGRDNHCSGTPEQLRSVGRRSGQMQGVGPHLGQCSPNDDVGSQYSFPAEAKCKPGARPGAESGCAWGDAVAVRTVEAKCIMQERGLLEACNHEIGHAPFKRAASIWLKAFASDDPALGGCPDASPEMVSIVV